MMFFGFIVKTVLGNLLTEAFMKTAGPAAEKVKQIIPDAVKNAIPDMPFLSSLSEDEKTKFITNLRRERVYIERAGDKKYMVYLYFADTEEVYMEQEFDFSDEPTNAKFCEYHIDKGGENNKPKGLISVKPQGKLSEEVVSNS